ncbi:MAG TPA: hypothetical protein VJ728_02690, partial [Candidatus Binataceae bacterium]|nr:hypothetical protein [Candidatus Binataceae bacterium]
MGFMTKRRAIILISVLLTSLSSGSFAQNGTCAGMDTGPGADLNGFIPFPADNAWNTDISSMPVDPNSDNIIAFIGANSPLHPDFGAGLYFGSSIGIPYQVIDTTTQPDVPIRIAAYKRESDPGPMPVPPDALIEGYPNPDDGDRHVLVLDRNNCWLYELSRAFKHGVWRADSTAIWDMTSNEQRPYTWTSADAAGLPIFPGLVRYDEVLRGVIKHAIRVTVPVTRQAFTPPASHWASSEQSQNAPPMGMRMRLKADFDISGFPANDQVILTALKQYGVIVADNGGAMFISGAPDDRWDNGELDQLKTLTASDFEVIAMGAVYTPANVPTGASPVVSS